MKRALVLFSVACAAALAQQPRVTNAKLETKEVSGSLASEIRGLAASQPGPLWIGYAVPIAGEHRSCCYYSDGNASYRGCALESGNFNIPAVQAGAPVQLEPAREALILYRAENKQVTDIRTFTADCELDAGGTPFYMLTGVKPAESVTVLNSFLTAKAETLAAEERIPNAALNAIAMHADPSAGTLLESYLAPDQPEKTRRRVTHAMGSRGKAGFEVLSRLLRQDADENVREAAVRALPQTRQPEAAQLITSVAENDKSAKVRGEALIALARFAGTRGAPVIQKAIETDPDRNVRHRGVSALTQLPAEQSVPMLITVVRSSKDADTRRQAMQWLGHSHDQRAEHFIQELLTK